MNTKGDTLSTLTEKPKRERVGEAFGSLADTLGECVGEIGAFAFGGAHIGFGNEVLEEACGLKIGAA